MSEANSPRRPIAGLVALLAVVILGLGAWLLLPWGSNAAAPELEGKTWRLVAINGQPAVPNSQATVKFASDKISGNSSVNSFGGTYRASGGTLTTSDLMSTLMASADPALNQQETTFATILQGESTYAVSGSQLTISSPRGTMTFAA